MKKLDKKQIPQVVVLAVLALGLFGYFAKTLFLTSPVSAKGPAPARAAVAPGSNAKAAPSAAAPGMAAEAAPPMPAVALRDPFAPAVASGPAAPPVQAGLPAQVSAKGPAAPPAPRLASLRTLPPIGISIPAAPALPFPAAAAPAPGRPTGSLPPLPVAPSWTVTGVLQSGSEHIAILRSGETRRFVKQGDYVDDRFQVAKVTRSFVVLSVGKSVFTLPLGGAKDKRAPSGTAVPASALAAPPAAAPVPFHPQSPQLAPPAAPQDMSRAAPARLRVIVPALRPLVTASAAPGNRLVLRLPTIKVADARGEWRAPVAAVTARPLARPMLAAARPQVHAVVRAAVSTRAPKATLAQYAPSTLASLLPIGSAAPDFSLPTLSGPRVALSDLRGRVVLLHFWASWVDSSAEDLAQLRRLQSAYGGRGLTVLNVNSWDNLPALRGAFAAVGSRRLYDQVYDPGISNESVAVSLYHAPDVPAFYVIDRNGSIAESFANYDAHTRAVLLKALHALGVAS